MLLVFGLVFALLVLVPASAEKPDCDAHDTHPSCKEDDSPPTTTPSAEECDFANGVLRGWTPPESYRCQWTVTREERKLPFDFRLEPVTPDGKTVNLPHLIVTDVFPYGGQICFNEYVVGWNKLPYSWTPVTLPLDGPCAGGGGTAVHEENVFAITIDVIKVKKGEVELQYTQTQPTVP
jgi:hypothetical protein